MPEQRRQVGCPKPITQCREESVDVRLVRNTEIIHLTISRRRTPKPEPPRFDADPIVHRSANPLFTAQITLGGLDRNVAE